MFTCDEYHINSSKMHLDGQETGLFLQGKWLLCDQKEVQYLALIFTIRADHQCKLIKMFLFITAFINSLSAAPL